MFARMHWIGTWAALLLAVGHIYMTTRLYADLTVPALWFAGTGLGLFAIGLLNLLALRERTGLGRGLALATNVMTTIFMTLLYWLHPAGQVLFGLVLFAILTLCALAAVAGARSEAEARA
ncbi:MAG: hypothetical protein Q8K11_14110 [Phenylobacterium sp.]|uniref:hypothetical protein n=1 Tax=Phenylobacterium sp. TaxID=1871053 RepID=UPI0027310F87|nr:hypothetical protein [Phenylobacterium sp.]MDP2011303.1 hypothetical protein [Phenylobacterium sp.]